MNIREARDAIEQILASIPDDELPPFDREELGEDGRVTVWWGSHGHVLGTARSNGNRSPINYRKNGSWDAIEGEMTYRRDAKFLAAGDAVEAKATS